MDDTELVLLLLLVAAWVALAAGLLLFLWLVGRE